MNSSAISSIVQAMLASSQPTVTQMIAARGGGGGGNRATAQGASMGFSGGGRSPQQTNIQAPEVSAPVGGETPSPEVQVPFRPGMSPEQVTQQQINPNSDPYQSGQYRQEDDPAMQFGGNPDSTALITQSLQAQLELDEARNPTTLREAFTAPRRMREAQQKVAQSQANIHSYEQAQVLKAKAQEAERVGKLADNAYITAMQATGGDKNLSASIATAVQNDPDNAQKYLGEMLGSMEAQRAEQAGYAREDQQKDETADERVAGLIGMGVDPAVARAFGWNTQDSMVDQLEFLSTKRVEEMEEQELKYLTERSTADTLANVDNQIRQINKSLDLVGTGTTGLLGAVFSAIPGSEAYELFGSIDTQRAATAFKALMEMREASKTGGALGNVSNREIELLYKSFAALDPKFGKELTKENLSDVLMNFERVKYMLENETRFAEEGLSGAEMYKMSTQAVNDRIAADQTREGYNVTGALESLRENPTAERIEEFKEIFGFRPLNLEMR